MPTLSPTAQAALSSYHLALAELEDVSPVTIRNYLSDLRQFAAWCKTTWATGHEDAPAWSPAVLATPLITRYRTSLQRDRQLKPASINRTLVSIKKYCTWCVAQELLARDPATAVRLVGAVPTPPRHLSDYEPMQSHSAPGMITPLACALVGCGD